MAADATAKARLERLLGELDKSAETPAGEDVDGGDYPISEYSSMSDVTESDADETRRAKRAVAQPGGAELSIIEQVDNGNSSVGIYYDEVDDMLAQQAHRQSEDAGASGEKELGSSVQVQPNDLAGQNQESSPSQHQQLGQMN